MKNIKIIVRVFLSILCLFSFSYGVNGKYLDSVAVGKTLGYKISHESFRLKNNKHVDISIVQKKLQNYLKDNSFRFLFSLITRQIKQNSDLYVEGVIVHADNLSRNIYTQFKANCSIKNRNLIIVDHIQLKNNAKPRSLFFIVPSQSLNINQLKSMNSRQALRKVNMVAKKLGNFNIHSDLQPTKYKLIAFMMNRLNDDDKVYVVLSDTAFGGRGKLAQRLKTKDGWDIFSLETVFAYNGDKAKYFNILWKKDGYLIAVDSLSTNSLIKSIQVSLLDRGYDIGVVDGTLNRKTKNAIKQYLRKSGFYKNSKISDSLLWFMQQYQIKDVSKIVQATLLANGINIGKIDGKIGHGTIKGIKKYQKEFGLAADGKITPELVRLLIQTSANADIYNRLSKHYNIPLLINQYQNNMWPNELF